MAQIRFDHLVTALADSVVQAEHVVRVHQINDIRNFFDDRNQPVCVPLALQRTDPTAKPGQMTELKVPLITLINIGHLSIKEMEIKFTTVLGNMGHEKTDRPKHYRESGAMSFDVTGAPEDSAETDPARESLGWTASRDVKTIDVTTSAVESNTASKAEITLKVQAGETPEGLARLLDHLHRMI